MSDTLTAWVFPCDKWTHITHITDITTDGEDTRIELCPGGKEITLTKTTFHHHPSHDINETEYELWVAEVNDEV